MIDHRCQSKYRLHAAPTSLRPTALCKNSRERNNALACRDNFGAAITCSSSGQNRMWLFSRSVLIEIEGVSHSKTPKDVPRLWRHGIWSATYVLEDRFWTTVGSSRSNDWIRIGNIQRLLLGYATPSTDAHSSSLPMSWYKIEDFPIQSYQKLESFISTLSIQHETSLSPTMFSTEHNTHRP